MTVKTFARGEEIRVRVPLVKSLGIFKLVKATFFAFTQDGARAIVYVEGVRGRSTFKLEDVQRKRGRKAVAA